jgi:hypothetical protein
MKLTMTEFKIDEFKIEPDIPILKIEREMSFEDLTGRRFGRLLAMERAEDYVNPAGQPKVQWLCKCDCGRENIVEAGQLRNGHTKSCGCLSAELSGERRRATVPDVVGQRFGRWFVLSQNGGWCQVRCDCGTEKTISHYKLKNTDSCGCLKLEMLAEIQRAKVMQHRNS